PYPFPHLCGAAVAFKLVSAALAEGKRRNLDHFSKVPNGWEKWLLDMVAIATISDMVPLVGENRVLAHFGLQVLRKSPRLGIAAQLEKLNASRKGVVGSIVKQVRRSVRERYLEGDRVVVLGNPEWKPALLGLAANSIMGERGGVVCLWGRDSNGNLKGSCRSD